MTTEQARRCRIHNRHGADTTWVEVCADCGDDWHDYIEAHPDEMSPVSILYASHYCDEAPTQELKSRVGT